MKSVPEGASAAEVPAAEAIPAAPKKISVNWEDLAMAFENQLPDAFSFLDLRNGQVVTFNSATMPPPPGPAEDFLLIQPRPSREGYRTMQQFIQTVEDPQLRRDLESTLVGRGAFRRFKDRLVAHPRERQRWFAFKDAAVYAYAKAWLEERGILPLNQPPQTAEAKAEKPAAPAPQIAPCAEAEDYSSVVAPYHRPQKLFRPARSALLVIDMQRAFLDPDGSAYLPTAATAGERLRRVAETCRRAGVPVFFTRHVHSYPQRDGGAMSRWWNSLILEGTREAELSDAVPPLPGEPIINKCRYGAFSGTPLEAMLRASGVEDVIIGGVMTNLCCETTAREAFLRDFNVFFLADATATCDARMQQATLLNIAYGFGRVLSSREAIAVLERHSACGAEGA